MKRIQDDLRSFLSECYGLDIKEAECYFSTQNYAYIFKGKPYMIRVSVKGNKTRANTLSELLWVDDLKLFSETICEPSVSLKNHYVEETVIDGKVYRAAMFRTAKGNVKHVTQMDPMYFICVGDLLGRIHAASLDVQRQGLRYQRPVLREKIEAHLNNARSLLDPKLFAKMEQTFAEFFALPDTDGEYGMIHGDFHSNNFFVDGNNIWVFDFDECCYGHFMYDIASIFITWLMYGYKIDKPRKQALYEDILPYFCIGYDLHMGISEERWKRLPLFLRVRQCIMIAALYNIQESGIVKDLEAMRRFVSSPLSYGDDLLEGLDAALRGQSVQTGFQQDMQPEVGDLKIEVRNNADCVVLWLEGKINAETVPFLKKQLMQIPPETCPALVFDCAGVSYINSLGLRLLLESHRKYEKLNIANASPFVREILEMTGLHSLLNGTL